MASSESKLENAGQTVTNDAKSEIIVQPGTLSQLSNFRRAILLAIFCLALFIDAYLTSAMIICLESISSDFHQATNVATWIITAYNLIFGSFLLLAGRLSDIYHPKLVFIAGFLLLSFLGLGAGFVNNIIALIVLRAFQGLGAAMTIPSATSMLTSAYTTPLSQGLALTTRRNPRDMRWISYRGYSGTGCDMALGTLDCAHDCLSFIIYSHLLDSTVETYVG